MHPLDLPVSPRSTDRTALLEPGAFADLFSHPVEPTGWAPVFALEGVQMVAPPAPPELARPDGFVELGATDVPHMLDLVDATRPGLFRPGTIRMGRYVGVRHGGAARDRGARRQRLPARDGGEQRGPRLRAAGIHGAP